MKYIKKYENKNSIEIGDYVLIKTTDSIVSDERINKAKEYVNTHIGICHGIRKGDIIPDLLVVYENIPEDIQSYFNMLNLKNNTGVRSFNLNRIVAYGKTPEEVEIKMSANKYNL